MDGDEGGLQDRLELLWHILAVLAGHLLLLGVLVVMVMAAAVRGGRVRLRLLLLIVLSWLLMLLWSLMLVHLLLLLELVLILLRSGLLLLLLLELGGGHLLLLHVLLVGQLLLLLLVLLLVLSELLLLGSLLLLHEGSLRLRLWRWYDDLIVLVAVLVAYFLLVVGAAPLAIDDVLVLVLARRQGVMRQPVLEDVAARVHALHRDPLLPVAEGANDEDFVAALAPGEDVLRWRWGHRLRRHNLLLSNSRHLLLDLLLLHLLLLLLLLGCDHLLMMVHVLLVYLLLRLLLLLLLLLVRNEALGSRLRIVSAQFEEGAVVGVVLLRIGQAALFSEPLFLRLLVHVLRIGSVGTYSAREDVLRLGVLVEAASHAHRRLHLMVHLTRHARLARELAGRRTAIHCRGSRRGGLDLTGTAVKVEVVSGIAPLHDARVRILRCHAMHGQVRGTSVTSLPL